MFSGLFVLWDNQHYVDSCPPPPRNFSVRLFCVCVYISMCVSLKRYMNQDKIKLLPSLKSTCFQYLYLNSQVCILICLQRGSVISNSEIETLFSVQSHTLPSVIHLNPFSGSTHSLHVIELCTERN